MSIQKSPIYIFGNTEYTPILIELYDVSGVIDLSNTYSQINNVINVPLSSVTSDSLIINTVNNSRAAQAHKMLLDSGFHNVAYIGEFINKHPNAFVATPLAQAQKGMQADYNSIISKLDLFEDGQSKDELSKICKFRLTLDINEIIGFDCLIDQQYFEDFLIPLDFKSMIDAGAYDGSDAKRFIELFPDYKSLHIFEPSPANFEQLTSNFSGLENIHLSKAGIGGRQDTLRFSGEGTAAKIDPLGEHEIQITTVDNICTKGPTLVKADIEGAEMDLLSGAKKSLADPRFSFAISAYHLPHDILNILNILTSEKLPKRKMFFRHYSGGYAESILFAI